MNRSTEGASDSCAVLVIEDEPSAREATARYLERHGHAVSTASDASAALAKAAQQVPDVIVCDWRLGDGSDGVEVARNLKQLFGAAIILMTAHPIDELREATRDLAVSRYFRKPISLPHLAEAVADSNQ